MNSKHLCYAVISDSLNHSKDSVHAFNEAVFNDLQTRFNFGISFVHYYTDGAASQFKSRYTVCDLHFHEKDFGFPADHSYFETSHGKGPHDGVGGEVKRVILRSELQKKIVINGAEEFANAATRLVSSINILYVPETKVMDTAAKLENRWGSCLPLHGLRKFHHISASEDGKSATLLINSVFSGQESKGSYCSIIKDTTGSDVESVKLCQGTFVLCKIMSEKNIMFRYVCIIQELLSPNIFRVMGLKAYFSANEKDIFTLMKNDVLLVLTEPIMECKVGSDRVRYKFNSPIDVNEA